MKNVNVFSSKTQYLSTTKLTPSCHQNYHTQMLWHGRRESFDFLNRRDGSLGRTFGSGAVNLAW